VSGSNLTTTAAAFLHALADCIGSVTAEAPASPEAAASPAPDATPEPVKTRKKREPAAPVAPATPPPAAPVEPEPQAPAELPEEPAAEGEPELTSAALLALIQPLIKGGRGAEVKALLSQMGEAKSVSTMHPAYYEDFKAGVEALLAK